MHFIKFVFQCNIVDVVFEPFVLQAFGLSNVSLVLSPPLVLECPWHRLTDYLKILFVVFVVVYREKCVFKTIRVDVDEAVFSEVDAQEEDHY